MSQRKNIVILSVLFIVVLAAGFFMTQSSEQNYLGQEEIRNGEVLEDGASVEPDNKPQAKIDVRVACESALMYTTFSSGVEAEAFVTECIEGKHPDVIERYLESLGIDDSAAI